jgi:coenzyme F420-reducing hydrogenase gamma subunit
MRATMEKYPGQYLMLVEGSIPTGADGVYCCIAGRSAIDIVKEAAAGAKALVAWGSCASNGCIQAANPNPTGTTPVHKIVSGKPIIKVPGCPPIGDIMAAVVVHLLAFDRIPQLDATGRPKAFYSKRVHDTCIRRASYDACLFVESWDDEAARRGYCLYKMGCRGPMTYNACSVTRWNEGPSYPIQSGHGCIGCSEEKFWDNGPFYQHLPSFLASASSLPPTGSAWWRPRSPPPGWPPTQYLQDHVVHFYHLHALDWVDIVSALKADPKATSQLAQKISNWPKSSPGYFSDLKTRLTGFVESGQLGIFANACWGHPAYKLPPEVNLIGVAHYLEALEWQKRSSRFTPSSEARTRTRITSWAAPRAHSTSTT